VDVHHVPHVVGLTLSRAQADWIAALARPQFECRVESWLNHTPGVPYDAIISIGAFEHFARAGLEPSLKLGSYRQFFERCHAWLKPSGRLSLQTIAYGNLSRADLSEFIAADIFPESDLPTLSEVAVSSQGLFEIVSHRNDREHYERTTREWLQRLRLNRDLAVSLVGNAVFERYDKYLSLFTIGFHTGRIHLLRITLQRNDSPRFWFIDSTRQTLAQ
jgi:cyclopropane-fatty-acyl-phospholipid synthase